MKNIIDEMSDDPLEAFRNFSMNPFSDILTTSDFQDISEEVLNNQFRRRKLTPQILFWILCFSGVFHSLAKAMRTAWNQVFLGCGSESAAGKAPSKAALSKARDRFPIDYFWQIFRRLRQRFLEHFQRDSLCYKDYLLLIIDGTKMDLPDCEPIREHFGAPSGQEDQPESNPQALVVCLINALTGFCFDFLTLPYADSEHDRMRELLDQIPETIHQKNPLLLLDAGFWGYKNLHALMESEVHFLMRVQKSISHKTVFKIGPGDKMVKLEPSQAVLRKYPTLPQELTVRLIRYQIPGFKPRYLITNLEPEEMSGKQLAGLYHWRWRIEVFYDEVKNILQLSNLRSQNTDGLRKEIISQMVFNNLIRFVMTEAIEDQDRPAFHFSFEKSCELIICASNKLGLHMFDPDGSNRFRETLIRDIYRRLLSRIRTFVIDQSEKIEHHENAYSEELKDPIDEDLIFFDPGDDEDTHLPYMQKEIA